MPSHVPCCCVMAASGLIASAAGAADVEILGGSRMVSAIMTGGPSDQQSAPAATGSWTGTATSLAPGPASARLTSLQISEVDPGGIIGNGSLTYSRLMQDPATGSATSVIDYFFRVNAPTTYTLRGDLREGSSGLITLLGSGGALHSGPVLDASGTLAPGVYEFTARVQLDAPQPGPGTARWSVALIVPGPGAASLALAALALAARRARSPIGDEPGPVIR